MTPVMFSYGGWQTSSFVAGEMRDPAARPRPRAAARRARRGPALHRGRLRLRPCAWARRASPQSKTPASDVMRLALGDTRRDLHRARHRDLRARLPQPGHADRAARLFRDGRGRPLLPQRRQGQRDAPASRSSRSCCRASRRSLIALSGTYGQILSYVVSVDFIFFGLTGAALFVFRRRDPGQPVASRRPAIPFTTGLFVAACAVIGHRHRLEQPANSLIGYAILAAGVPACLYWQRKNRRRRMRTMQSDYMHWAKFKPPVAMRLTASEVPHFRMDSLPIDARRPRSRWRQPPALRAAARSDRARATV